MRPLRVELAAGLLLVSCGGQATEVQAGSGLPAAPLASLVLTPDPARPLTGYSWEGEGFVPVLGDAPRALVPGEVGVTPSTRLYLRGEDLERELAPVWSSDERVGVERVPGRFGSGLELGKSSRLVLVQHDLPSSAEGWSLELWLRPLERRAGIILSLMDLFEVASEAGGRVVVKTQVEAPDGPRTVMTRSPGELVLGEWNHLGIVLDTGIVQHLRVVLNGQVRSERLDGKGPQVFQRLSLGAPSGARQSFPAVLDEVRLQARVANSSEFEAHWLAGRAPLQRVTLTDAAGSELREFWTRAVEFPRLGPGADWSVGDLRHLAVDQDGLTWVAGDWQRVPALEPPLARTTAPVLDVGHDTLFLFSGEVRDSHYGRMVNLPDTWLFHTDTERWERIETSVAPRGRCHQPAAYSPDHDVVLMTGGWINDRNPGELLNDLWLFHVGERRWEERKPAGLPTLSDSVVVYHPGRRVFVILSGSWVYTYDPATDRLDTPGRIRLTGSQVPVEPPMGPIAALDPRTNLLWLFGGAFKDSTVEDFSDAFASFDLETRTMTFYEGPRPSARVRSAFAWDPDRERFVLFGGVREQKSTRFDDLWTLDPGTQRWVEQPYSGGITRRGGYYGMGYSSSQRRFFLLTGRHSYERFLEEAWTLSLDEHAEGRARYLFDRASFTDEAAWFLEAEAADGTIAASFRTSEDGRSFGPSLETCPATGRYVEVEVRVVPGPSLTPPRVRALGFRAPQ